MASGSTVKINFSALVVSWWLRLWLSEARIDEVMDDPDVLPHSAPRPYIYLFWHENMVLAAYQYAHLPVATLISKHRDGELVAGVVRMMRGRSIRGSSTKGALAVVRTMMRKGATDHLAITPDGPRGPRRFLHSGAVYLASRSAMPVVPVGIAFDHCWRAASWDRMAVPLPWGRSCVVFGSPRVVPPGLDRAGLEAERERIQGYMTDVQTRAETRVRANGQNGSG